jgi:hypothetical protein
MTALKLHAILALFLAVSVSAFTIPRPDLSVATLHSRQLSGTPIFLAKENDGVVELADDESTTEEEEKAPETAVAPFLSQGEVSEEPMDLSDPKQARVMFYIILSLIPVLFLIPLMLGSREMIPAEMLPPVELM